MTLVKRLKASKEKTNSAEFKAGLELGIEWATEDAETRDLEQLATFHTPEQVWANSDLLACTIDPDISPEDEGAIDTFWEVAVGIDNYRLLSRPAFLRGFVEGALSVWDSVKDQL